MIKDEVNLYKSQSNVFNIRELLDELIHNYKENVSNKLNIKFFANENQNLLVNGQKSADNVIEGGNIIGAKFIVNLPLAD